MANETVSIQVGDRLTEICRAVKRGREYEIKDYFTFQNPPNLVSDGMIMDVERYAAALTEQLRMHNLISVKQVAFTISSGRIASREVTLPAVKENQIQDLVRTNSAEYFPVDMTLYIVSYCMLGKVPSAAGGWNITVKAAPRDLLKSFTSLADRLGMKIMAIDTAGNSTYQILKKLKPEKLSMYLDISTSRTVCTLLNGSEYILQRVFPYGGDELVLPYLEKTGRGEDGYSAALAELERDGLNLIDSETAEEELDRFVVSAVRVNDFARSVKNIDVERIVILGQCSHLPWIKEKLAEKTGVTVEEFGETAEVKKFTNSAGTASNYLSCLGSLIAPVDLIPPEYGAKKKVVTTTKGFTMQTAVVVMAGFIAVGAVVGLSAFFPYLTAKQNLESINSEIASLEPAKQAYESYVAYEGNASNIKIITEEALGRNSELRAVFEELEKKMPSSILMLSATCAKDGISMDVTVNNLPDAAAVIAQLRTFESFDVISVSGIAEEGDQATGAIRQHFTVNCAYPLPAPPEPEVVEEESTEAASDETAE